jgi:hypothetical protein
MKRLLIAIALLFGLVTSVASAQSRVGVSLSFGDPYAGGHVWLGRPYHRYYSRPYYSRPYYSRSYHHRYHPAPVIIVAPRVYRSPRVVVVRPHRYHGRRYHRH